MVIGKGSCVVYGRSTRPLLKLRAKESCLGYYRFQKHGVHVAEDPVLADPILFTIGRRNT